MTMTYDDSPHGPRHLQRVSDQETGSESPSSTSDASKRASPTAASANEAQASRRRGGAPKHNTNALKHGMRSKLPGSKLSKKDKSDERVVAALAKQVQAQWEHDNGRPMGLGEESILLELRRAMTKDRLAAKWLREQGEGSDVALRLKLLDASLDATRCVQRCLERLGLSQAGPSSAESEEEYLDRLWATPAATPEQLAEWDEETEE